MDKTMLLQQLMTGNVDNEAIEEYIKNSRPDLLPALQMWQLSNKEATRGRRTNPHHRHNEHSDDDDLLVDSEDLLDVGGRILHSLDAIHKELRKLGTVP